MNEWSIFHKHVMNQSVHIESKNKAEYTATLVACGWAGAVPEKATRASGQEPYAHKAQKRQKSNRSPKGNMWSAIPVALLWVIVNWSEKEQGSGPEGDKVL